MSSPVVMTTPTTSNVLPTEQKRWYAVETRTRCEKGISTQLDGKGVETFLPTYTQVHRWKDRRKAVELAMFPGYVFVHTELTPETRLKVLQTFGVFTFVTFNGEIPAIPDEQIDCLAQIERNKLSYGESPFIKVGQRLRVRGGCLDGLEGILEARQGKKFLIISIDPIQRSISVPVDSYDLETIAEASPA